MNWQSPLPRYVQEFTITFADEAAAGAASVDVAPLYNGHRVAVSCRWDDNFPGNPDAKARMDARGVKGTWYLNSNGISYHHTGNYVPTARTLLEGGHSVGGHSLTHPYLTYVSRNRMFREIAGVRVEWEAALDAPVLSFTYPYINFRSEAEGVAVHRDLLRTLERAGFYHLAEFMGPGGNAHAPLILSPVMPPENTPFDTFAQAVEWASNDPVVLGESPCISNSMHAWYGTDWLEYGWEELEKRLDLLASLPDAWHCNQNAYAAYRRQFQDASLELLGREGAVARYRLLRPEPRFLNDMVPLTLAVASVDPGAVVAVRCDTAEVVTSDRGDRILFHLTHDHGRGLPARIGRVENVSNVTEPGPAHEDPDFPGLRVLLSFDGSALRLQMTNGTGAPLEDMTVTWRLPLEWTEAVVVQPLEPMPPDAVLDRYWQPGARATDPLYHQGERYLVAQVDFVSAGVAGRLYATCTYPEEPDASFPNGRFSVLGPIQPDQFDQAAFASAVADGTAYRLGWTLLDGSIVAWRTNPSNGPIGEGHLSPETVRTQGDWKPLETPLYVLQAFVDVPSERPFRVVGSADDLRQVFLNGANLAPPFDGILRQGENRLVVVYHKEGVSGTGRNAACFLRLTDPATGARIPDIAYRAPVYDVSTGTAPDQPEEKPMLTIALLQMLADGFNQEANLLKADTYCRQAAAQGTDIALFPEMFNIGYTGFHGNDEATVAEWQARAVGLDSPWITHFRELAKELDMAVAAAFLEATPDGPRNSVALIDRHGEIRFTYGKIHTCDFASFEAVCTPGDRFHVAELDTRHGRVQVGAMICYDREFPESARTLMLDGAEIVLTPNACQLDDKRLAQFMTRALENSMAVFMTNYPAPAHGGRSVAYGPNGEQLALAGPDEGITIAQIDLKYLRDYRAKTIWGNAFRRPHKYGRLTETGVAEVFRRTDALGRPFDPSQR